YVPSSRAEMRPKLLFQAPDHSVTESDEVRPVNTEPRAAALVCGDPQSVGRVAGAGRERSSPCRFFRDCTIAMRGYDFREGGEARLAYFGNGLCAQAQWRVPSLSRPAKLAGQLSRHALGMPRCPPSAKARGQSIRPESRDARIRQEVQAPPWRAGQSMR